MEITLTSMCISNSWPRLSCNYIQHISHRMSIIMYYYSCTSVILWILLILSHNNELVINDTYLSDYPILTVYKACSCTARVISIIYSYLSCNTCLISRFAIITWKLDNYFIFSSYALLEKLYAGEQSLAILITKVEHAYNISHLV